MESLNVNVVDKGRLIDPKTIFGFDDDFIGVNGEVFTSDAAISAGFNSDLEYYTYKARQVTTGDNQKFLDIILNGFMEINHHYYWMDIKVVELENKSIIASAVYSLI